MMQKSRWIIASSAIALAMGFGHAGCYTSGIPGGPAAGGAPVTETGGTGSTDSDPDAADAAVTCADSRDCLSNEVCDPHTLTCVGCWRHEDCTITNQVCDLIAKRCVDCLNDDQCQAPYPYCDSVNQCVGCLSQAHCLDSERCLDKTCVAKVPCSTDVVCTPSGQICVDADADADADAGAGAGAGYCGECESDAYCQKKNGTVCQNGFCVAPASSQAAGGAS